MKKETKIFNCQVWLLLSAKQNHKIFVSRSHSDWKDAWHKEKYARCRETLIRHLYWACEKDIYRLTRRSPANDYNTYDIEEGEKIITCFCYVFMCVFYFFHRTIEWNEVIIQNIKDSFIRLVKGFLISNIAVCLSFLPIEYTQKT